MKIQIKNRYDGLVIFECEATTMAEAVKEALAKKSNLRSADLSSADLSSADLRSANLSSADLSSANLSSADLSSADLRSADLSSADLSSANLRSADLSSADLSSANLRSANLRSADLSYANLRSADLSYADLSSADLSSAKNSEYAIAVTRILPEGALIGWKKCNGNVIVKLLIPAKAKRSSAFGRKCRAEYVKVLDVIGGDEGVTNEHGPETRYVKGKVVRANSWDEDFTKECSNGIHFFITRLEADKYEP